MSAEFRAAQLEALMTALDLPDEEYAALAAAVAAQSPPEEEAGLIRQFAREWEEEKHPRDEGGRFAERAGIAKMDSGDSPITAGTDMDRQALESWSFADSASGVDPADMDANVDAFRLQDGRKPMPVESSSHWTGDEGNTMSGVSGYANAANVIGDMLFGDEESVTGENYTRNIEEEGGEPQLWLLVSDYEALDAPGAELVIPEARVAGKFSRRQVWDALKQAMAEDFPEVTAYEEWTEEWAIEHDVDDFDDAFPRWHRYADDALEILRERMREVARGQA